MRRIAAAVVFLVMAVAAVCLSSADARAAGPAKYQATRFGVFYDTWHCLLTERSRGRTPFDISKARAGVEPWGPVPEFHYWTEPALGYYCLDPKLDAAARQGTDVDGVLRLHARELREAGIDFIILDASNNDLVGDGPLRSKVSIEEPFAELIRVWSQIPDAPKVAVFAPLTAKGTMFEWLLAELAATPGLEFRYLGKPLALVVDNASFPVDADKVRRLTETHTIRRMWAMAPEGSDNWSFMNPCADDAAFRAAGGAARCDQAFARRDGRPEQIPVAAAFQETYASNSATAVPKFHGRTFAAQFATAFAHPEAPIVTIDAWNEWMGQRFCLDANRQPSSKGCTADNDHFANGAKVFVDTYDAEYSRDIEPSKAPPGDFYLRLMTDCIAKFRAGKLCRAEDISYPG